MITKVGNKKEGYYIQQTKKISGKEIKNYLSSKTSSGDIEFLRFQEIKKIVPNFFMGKYKDKDVCVFECENGAIFVYNYICHYSDGTKQIFLLMNNKAKATERAVIKIQGKGFDLVKSKLIAEHLVYADDILFTVNRETASAMKIHISDYKTCGSFCILRGKREADGILQNPESFLVLARQPMYVKTSDVQIMRFPNVLPAEVVTTEELPQPLFVLKSGACYVLSCGKFFKFDDIPEYLEFKDQNRVVYAFIGKQDGIACWGLNGVLTKIGNPLLYNGVWLHPVNNEIKRMSADEIKSVREELLNSLEEQLDTFSRYDGSRVVLSRGNYSIEEGLGEFRSSTTLHTHENYLLAGDKYVKAGMFLKKPTLLKVPDSYTERLLVPYSDVATLQENTFQTVGGRITHQVTITNIIGTTRSRTTYLPGTMYPLSNRQFAITNEKTNTSLVELKEGVIREYKSKYSAIPVQALDLVIDVDSSSQVPTLKLVYQPFDSGLIQISGQFLKLTDRGIFIFSSDKACAFQVQAGFKITQIKVTEWWDEPYYTLLSAKELMDENNVQNLYENIAPYFANPQIGGSDNGLKKSRVFDKK